MRIVYMINGFNQGGAEHGLLTLIENGFFSGHEIVVLGLCRGHGRLADAMSTAVGFDRFKIADNTEDLTFRAMFKGAKVLAKELKEFSPDIVVLSLKQANIVGRLVLSFCPGVRCVSFEHIMRYRSRRFQWVYRYILWALSFRVDEIWGDCQDTIDATSRYFMPGRRRETHVVPLFCVPKDLTAKKSYAIDGPLKIVVAGRLSPVKNIDKVINAIRRLRDGGRDVRMDIFGNGPEHASLEAQIERMELNGTVKLLGYKEDWQSEATSYDLYVSASDTEGFCIVVAEAMAVGLPVVATDVGGIREYGLHNGNMIKVETPDGMKIAAEIARLADDEALRCRLGTRAAVDMATHYSVGALRSVGMNVIGTS